MPLPPGKMYDTVYDNPQPGGGQMVYLDPERWSSNTMYNNAPPFTPSPAAPMPSPAAAPFRPTMGDWGAHAFDRFMTLNPFRTAEMIGKGYLGETNPQGAQYSPYKAWLYNVLSSGVGEGGAPNYDALQSAVQALANSGVFEGGNNTLRDLVIQNVNQNPELRENYLDSRQILDWNTPNQRIGQDPSNPLWEQVGWDNPETHRWNLLQHLNRYFGGGDVDWEQVLKRQAPPEPPPPIEEEIGPPDPPPVLSDDILRPEVPTSAEMDATNFPIGTVRADARGRSWIVIQRPDGTIKWSKNGWSNPAITAPTWGPSQPAAPETPAGGGVGAPIMGALPSSNGSPASPDAGPSAGMGMAAPMAPVPGGGASRVSGFTAPRAPSMPTGPDVPRATPPSGFTTPSRPGRLPAAPRAPRLRGY